MCFNEDQVVYENNACLWDAAIVVLISTAFDTTKLERVAIELNGAVPDFNCCFSIFFITNLGDI
jgi:hypothetical protein